MKVIKDQIMSNLLIRSIIKKLEADDPLNQAEKMFIQPFINKCIKCNRIFMMYSDMEDGQIQFIKYAASHPRLTVCKDCEV